MPQDKDILAPLVDELVERAGQPGEESKRRMWADHQALRRGGVGKAKIPVTVYYEGIPAEIWQGWLGEFVTCVDPVARSIERDLRKRLWIARNVPDDHIVWPAVFVWTRATKSADWGVPLEHHRPKESLGAYAYAPPLKDALDTSRIRFTDQQIDPAETARAVEKATELTGGKVAVHVSYPALGHCPFDLAVDLRGMEQIMMDAIERPEALLALMEIITAGYEQHHQTRQRLGHIDRHVSADGKYLMSGFRVHAWHAPMGPTRPPTLSDEWAYVSAQTSAGFGPAFFEQFVHPFNCRLARYFTNRTVYYHGCETLDRKFDALASLPNLRRMHVSPWSSVATAVAKFGDRVVLEVHAHPGKVFFGGTADSIRAELRELIAAADGAVIDLNLSDIHSVDGRPETLGLWARVAQELAGG